MGTKVHLYVDFPNSSAEAPQVRSRQSRFTKDLSSSSKALRIASIHPARPPVYSYSLVGFECQSLAGRNAADFLFLGRALVKLTVGVEQASLSAYFKVTCNSPPFLKAALSGMSKVMPP